MSRHLCISVPDADHDMLHAALGRARTVPGQGHLTMSAYVRELVRRDGERMDAADLAEGGPGRSAMRMSYSVLPAVPPRRPADVGFIAGYNDPEAVRLYLEGMGSEEEYRASEAVAVWWLERHNEAWRGRVWEERKEAEVPQKA